MQLKKQTYLKLLKDLINKNEYFLTFNVNNYTNSKILKLRSAIKRAGNISIKLNNGLWNYINKENSSLHIKEDSILIAFKDKQNYLKLKDQLNNFELSETSYLKENDKISETYTYPEGPTKLKGASFYAILEPVTSIRLQKNLIVLEKPLIIPANKKISSAQSAALKVLKVPLKKRSVELCNIFIKENNKLKKLSKEYISTYLNPKVAVPELNKLLVYLEKTLYPTSPVFLNSRFYKLINYFKAINNNNNNSTI